jgi:hypothetical protein
MLANNRITFESLARDEQAIVVYDEVVRRFGEATESALKQSVAVALINRGIILESLRRDEEEMAVYEIRARAAVLEEDARLVQSSGRSTPTA